MSEPKREGKKRYTAILRGELIPAMGYTESIATAYAASVTDGVFGEEIRCMVLSCSGSVIRNVETVAVPNANEQKKIMVAGILGLIDGSPEKQLEVTADVTDGTRGKACEFAVAGFHRVFSTENALNLYITVKVFGDGRTVEVIIEEKHTNTNHVFRDKKKLERGEAAHAVGNSVYKTPHDHMNLKGALMYAEEAGLSRVCEALQHQVEYNLAISQEGPSRSWGTNIGSTILEIFNSDVGYRTCTHVTTDSDARMSGCPMLVVINSGSGNQGITAGIPVAEYARRLQVSEDRMLRVLIMNNLVSAHTKHCIGVLSTLYGAVSASCDAGADISLLCGGDYAQIPRAIMNTLGNVGGIVYGSAEPSCTAKIVSPPRAAIPVRHMSIGNRCFQTSESIIRDDIGETTKDMGYIGRVDMCDTGKEILRVVTDGINVDGCI